MCILQRFVVSVNVPFRGFAGFGVDHHFPRSYSIFRQGFGKNDENLAHGEHQGRIVPRVKDKGQQFLLHDLPLPQQQTDGSIQIVVAPERSLQILEPIQAVCDRY